MKKIVANLLKIANELDELGLHLFAEQTTDVAEELLAEADMCPVPSKQPQIQKDPINQNPKEKDANKEFSKDKKDKGKKKPKDSKEKGIVEGRDFILHTKQEK